MDKIDHVRTSSHRHQGNAGKAYREKISQLLNSGHWRTAMAIEIMDIRRVAKESGNPTKYNETILEMLAYAKCMNLLGR
jgi:putative rhs-family protein